MKIIFDLDGTLWKIDQIYLIVLDRLKKEFPIENITNAMLLSVIGYKYDDLIDTLFDNHQNKIEIKRKALAYAIEEINNLVLDLTQVEKLFETLSFHNDIYIISNCPRGYLDAFYNKCKVEKYVNQAFTIEDGTKEENIRIVSCNYRDICLFVGDANEDYEAIKSHDVVHFAYIMGGYDNIVKYDYKINKLEDIYAVIMNLNQINQMIELPFEIINFNETKAIIYLYEGVYYFGFLDIKNNEDFKQVIDAIKDKTQGYQVIGPMNGKTWYDYRITLDQFDFNLIPDCISNQEVLDIFFAKGFKIHQAYSSTLATINYPLWNIAKRVKLGDEFKVINAYGDDCYQYLDDLYLVSKAVFSAAEYYRDISLKDFKSLYLDKLKNLNKDVVLIFYGDKLIAFNFCYEDPLKRFYVSKTIGILSEFRGSKVLLKIIDESYKNMTAKGYKEVLYHFQNEKTKVLEAISRGYKIKKKRFALLEYKNE